MTTPKEFALYNDEDIVAIGTLREIAEQEGIQLQTMYYYNSKKYKETLKNRPDGGKAARILVSLDDDLDD